MTQYSLYTSEHLLATSANTDIVAFWQQGDFSDFAGVNGTRIHYCAFIRQQSKGNLFIIPGRCESYLKYQELCYEMFQQGYSVFSLDHRGQGLSDRLLNNVDKGFVEDFSYYASDLASFIDTIQHKNPCKKNYLLAHSMGGAIALRYLQIKPANIDAAVLSSPMLGFNSGSVPKVIAQGILNTAYVINQAMSKSPWYFFGQGGYCETPFSENKLTHSQKRYQDFINLYRAKPHIRLGGVTLKWLREGVIAQKHIFAQLDKLATPILVLQATADKIVNNNAQNIFCQQLHKVNPSISPNDAPVQIEGAYHELFFEQDSFRNKALSQALTWLNNY